MIAQVRFIPPIRGDALEVPLLSPIAVSASSAPSVADMGTSAPHTVFPNTGMRILSASIHLLGSSILAYFIARRINTVRITSISDIKTLSWPRCCVMLVLVDSWLFTFSAGILIHGFGMSSTFNACSAGIYLCIWLYSVSKLLIYWFLIEKVRIVWDILAQPRLSSPVYLICLGVMLPFFAMPAILIVGRIAYFRADMTCVIGLKAYSSLTLLTYDLCINVFLNGMFLWPLVRRLTNPLMRAVAKRTLYAAAAALITSIVNIATLTIMKGQLGWVCLGSCSTDVTLNALVLFWVTSSIGEVTPGQTLPTQAQHIPTSQATKPNSEQLTQQPTTVDSLIPFPSPGAYSSRVSLNITQVPPKALEVMHHQPIDPFVSSSTRPSLSREDISNFPLFEQGPSAQPQTRLQNPIESLRRLFGLSAQQKEKDVEVRVSVATRHEIELSGVGSGERTQEDGASIRQPTPPSPSQWYR